MFWFPSLLPVLAVALGCGLLAACTVPPADEAATTPSVSRMGQEYVIGSGDTLSIFVYHAPELSEPGVPVRPDGRISVPLIQDIQASGLTAAELSHQIEERLRKYVRDPNVTVIVRNFVGPLNRQIKVIGEATEPEAIPYRDNMTLLDVMIATKGLTKFAAGNRAIVVRRTGPGQEKILHVRLGDLIKDGDISQNIAMQPGDTIIIPQTYF
ncbi:MAG: XrtA/PEP-CTERM system exopolysaccharide export protein [Acetobacteraceae bacterium]